MHEIAEPALNELIASTCERGCLKQRLWPANAKRLDAPLDEIPVICPKPCNYFVSHAREKLKGRAGSSVSWSGQLVVRMAQRSGATGGRRLDAR